MSKENSNTTPMAWHVHQRRLSTKSYDRPFYGVVDRRDTFARRFSSAACYQYIAKQRDRACWRVAACQCLVWFLCGACPVISTSLIVYHVRHGSTATVHDTRWLDQQASINLTSPSNAKTDTLLGSAMNMSTQAARLHRAADSPGAAAGGTLGTAWNNWVEEVILLLTLCTFTYMVMFMQTAVLRDFLLSFVGINHVTYSLLCFVGLGIMIGTQHVLSVVSTALFNLLVILYDCSVYRRQAVFLYLASVLLFIQSAMATVVWLSQQNRILDPESLPGRQQDQVSDCLLIQWSAGVVPWRFCLRGVVLQALLNLVLGTLKSIYVQVKFHHGFAVMTCPLKLYTSSEVMWPGRLSQVSRRSLSKRTRLAPNCSPTRQHPLVLKNMTRVELFGSTTILKSRRSIVIDGPVDPVLAVQRDSVPSSRRITVRKRSDAIRMSIGMQRQALVQMEQRSQCRRSRTPLSSSSMLSRRMCTEPFDPRSELRHDTGHILSPRHQVASRNDSDVSVDDDAAASELRFPECVASRQQRMPGLQHRSRVGTAKQQQTDTGCAENDRAAFAVVADSLSSKPILAAGQRDPASVRTADEQGPNIEARSGPDSETDAADAVDALTLAPTGTSISLAKQKPGLVHQGKHLDNPCADTGRTDAGCVESTAMLSPSYPDRPSSAKYTSRHDSGSTLDRADLWRSDPDAATAEYVSRTIKSGAVNWVSGVGAVLQDVLQDECNQDTEISRHHNMKLLWMCGDDKFDLPGSCVSSSPTQQSLHIVHPLDVVPVDGKYPESHMAHTPSAASQSHVAVGLSSQACASLHCNTGDTSPAASSQSEAQHTSQLAHLHQRQQAPPVAKQAHKSSLEQQAMHMPSGWNTTSRRRPSRSRCVAVHATRATQQQPHRRQLSLEAKEQQTAWYSEYLLSQGRRATTSTVSGEHIHEQSYRCEKSGGQELSSSRKQRSLQTETSTAESGVASHTPPPQPKPNRQVAQRMDAWFLHAVQVPVELELVRGSTWHALHALVHQRLCGGAKDYVRVPSADVQLQHVFCSLWLLAVASTLNVVLLVVSPWVAVHGGEPWTVGVLALSMVGAVGGGAGATWLTLNCNLRLLLLLAGGVRLWHRFLHIIGAVCLLWSLTDMSGQVVLLTYLCCGTAADLGDALAYPHARWMLRNWLCWYVVWEAGVLACVMFGGMSVAAVQVDGVSVQRQFQMFGVEVPVYQMGLGLMIAHFFHTLTMLRVRLKDHCRIVLFDSYLQYRRQYKVMVHM